MFTRLTRRMLGLFPIESGRKEPEMDAVSGKVVGTQQVELRGLHEGRSAVLFLLSSFILMTSPSHHSSNTGNISVAQFQTVSELGRSLETGRVFVYYTCGCSLPQFAADYQRFPLLNSQSGDVDFHFLPQGKRVLLR